MSTAAISSSSAEQGLQAYFKQRQADLSQLGQDLKSGDLQGAQQEFNAVQSLGQNGPFANGDAFKISERQSDFTTLGSALQSGNLASSQHEFNQLYQTFHSSPKIDLQPPTQPSVVISIGGTNTPPASTTGTPDTTGTTNPATATPAAVNNAPANNGSEIVLNLGNATSGEQISINLSNTSGGEQVTIGVSGQQNQSPEQITINLGSASGGGEQVTIGVSGQQNQSPEQVTVNLNQNSNEQIVLNLLNSTSAPSATSNAVNVSA